jgi:glycosyltransferase involved in cell wall biosynthesis
LTQFALQAGQAALSHELIRATISVSRRNERFSAFEKFGSALFPIDTFGTDAGALLCAWRITGIRRRLAERLKADRTLALIDLMPHVWSPYIAPIVRAQGAQYIAVIHDAVSHRGDRSGWARGLADRSMCQADLIITLSQAVASRLVEMGRVHDSKVVKLFHPDLDYGAAHLLEPPAPGAPTRLLFLGRILPYKGLAVFLDAVELLQSKGHTIEVGVFGEGPLGACGARLEKLRAQVVNRWLTEEELAAIFPKYHALVLAHTQASQSGVAAAALGAGLPVVAAPVGGLVEQIRDGETGILAQRPDASALADAIGKLANDAALYRRISQGIADTRCERSMVKFVDLCVREVLPWQTRLSSNMEGR